jgi:hypothetical protein
MKDNLYGEDLLNLLSNVKLIVIDKKSKFYGCIGRADHWVIDKPNHIWFESLEKENYGREILSTEQFAVLESELERLDREIEELIEKRKALENFKIYRPQKPSNNYIYEQLLK